ncbi:MAG: sec-independent protein translocase protein TatA [Mycobacterium sp.]|jgi:sec-independent protein translocase protein TatA|nr:sec-independent protein translocase protein TatA [Mycobacterium sp.]
MWTNGFGWPHLLILVAVLVLLFGAKKLPDAARSLGKSMRIFKSEIKELNKDGNSDEQPKVTPVQSERVETPAPEQNHTDARPA